MKESKHHEQLPVGDVIGSSTHQKRIQEVLGDILNKAKGQALMDAERNVRITKIQSVPTTFLTGEVFYEERSIYNSSSPSGYIKNTSSVKHDSREYDMWEVDCPSPNQLFAAAKNIVRIADSMHLSDCLACNTDGFVPCTCYNGSENCPTCFGNGGYNCGSCGGRGEYTCSFCYGRGYTVRNEIIGYDKDNVPIWGDREYTCARCSGSGWETCSNCSGSGYLTCNTCHGLGSITCQQCGGTCSISCTSCTGLGFFLDEVNVSQSFDTVNMYSVINEFPFDSTLYNSQEYKSFSKSDKDVLIAEYIREVPIVTLPTKSILSNLYDTDYDCTAFTNKLKGIAKCAGNDRRALQYRICIYQREIIEAEYEFQGKTYHLHVNTSTDAVYMDKNPYENAAATLLQEVETHAKERHFKAFLESYEEFKSITSFDNIAYTENNILPYMKQLNRICGFVSIGAGLLVQLLLSLIHYGAASMFTEGGLLTLYLPSLAAGFLVSKLWKKIASDKKQTLYCLLGGLSAVAAILIHVILG